MSLKLEDMVFGEYYKVFLEGSDEKQYAIIRYDDIADNGDDRNRILGPMVSNMASTDKFYYKKKGRLYQRERKTVPATPEETAWLKACIQADNLVDKQLTGVIPDIYQGRPLDVKLLSHKDIKEGEYYHVTYKDKKAENWVIMRTDSQDDDHRWTGPTINCDDGESEFEDGSDDSHGAYFGGEDNNDWNVDVRYATKDEMHWLNECINAGELVARPVEDHRPSEDSDNVVVTQITPGNMTPEMVMEHIKQLVKQQKQGKMDKYITQLTPDMVGRHIKCRIDGKKISEALILATGGEYYLCQDVIDGTAKFEDKGGYKYTYNCGSGTSELLQDVQVSVIEFIEKIGKFKVGDYVLLEKNPEDRGWVGDMDKFSGRIALITKEKDKSQGVFNVNVDKGNWSWSDKSFKESGTKAIPPKELVKGEIYVYIGSDSNPQDHIFRSSETGTSSGRCDTYMMPKSREYHSGGGGLGDGKFRTCTPKEKVHMLACIEAKKYVDPPKEEEMKQSIEIDPDVLIQMILNNQ